VSARQGMAERARKGIFGVDGLKAISLDEVPDGGLDVLWDQLKSLTADRPDDLPQGGGVDRSDAEATLQRAEDEAMNAARTLFDKIRVEAEQELAGAQRVKAAALEAQREAENALNQANEIRAAAREQADELVADVESSARETAEEAETKAKKLIADAEAKAQKIEADAETGAQEALRAAASASQAERESLRAEAVEEIKAVKSAIERLREELTRSWRPSAFLPGLTG